MYSAAFTPNDTPQMVYLFVQKGFSNTILCRKVSKKLNSAPPYFIYLTSNIILHACEMFCCKKNIIFLCSWHASILLYKLQIQLASIGYPSTIMCHINKIYRLILTSNLSVVAILYLFLFWSIHSLPIGMSILTWTQSPLRYTYTSIMVTTSTYRYVHVYRYMRNFGLL